jgi:DNA-binding LacI/PurR family transcriptional regulator
MSSAVGIGSTVYQSLADDLRKSIGQGEYAPGQWIGSEHELARQRSISRMTVRRASEVLIGEGLLERKPGKGLFVKVPQTATRQIQVIAGNLAWDSCLKIARGVQAAGRPLGLRVQICDAHGDAEMDLEVVRQLPESGMTGAVILSFHSPALNEAIYRLKAEGFPFVLVDQRMQDIDVPSVVADNYDGGLQACRAVLAEGHRRVAFLGDLAARTTADRLSGFRDALGDAGLPVDRSLVVDLDGDQDRLGDWSARVERATADLMGRPSPPTALFCSCDAVARSAYRALAAAGLNVPGDVSVVGFDDDPLAEWLSPGLATVRQPFHEMGERAVQCLRERMADPLVPVAQHVLPVSFVRRASLGPAR